MDRSFWKAFSKVKYTSFPCLAASQSHPLFSKELVVILFLLPASHESGSGAVPLLQEQHNVFAFGHISVANKNVDPVQVALCEKCCHNPSNITYTLFLYVALTSRPR